MTTSAFRFTRRTSQTSNWKITNRYWVKDAEGTLLGAVDQSMNSTRTGSTWLAFNTDLAYVGSFNTRKEAAAALAAA